MNASQLPGRVLSSLLCDHIRARYLHVTVLLMAALLVVPFWLSLTSQVREEGDGQGTTRRVEMAYVFAVLYGLLHGAAVALVANDIQELLALGDQEAQGSAVGEEVERAGCVSVERGGYGQLSGAGYTLAAPCMLSGPLINGQLIDTVGVRAVGVWAAGCFGLGALLMSVSMVVGGSGQQQNEAGDECSAGADSGAAAAAAAVKGESWSHERWSVAVASSAS